MFKQLPLVDECMDEPFLIFSAELEKLFFIYTAFLYRRTNMVSIQFSARVFKYIGYQFDA